MIYAKPDIVETDIKVSVRGRYPTRSGMPRGLIIHYTSGRFDTHDDTINSLRHMAESGLGCMAMDIDGKIYRAANQPLDKVAFHAGNSMWQGQRSISYYCVGIEVSCAGLLSAGETWWGTKIPKELTRHISDQRDNQKPGTYHAFTALQEASLINFCLWQLDTNPEFKIGWIVGHDEVAPNRKSDPGGSLSMTMPDFREMIRTLSAKVA